jgi:hypothetical protein
MEHGSQQARGGCSIFFSVRARGCRGRGAFRADPGRVDADSSERGGIVDCRNPHHCLDNACGRTTAGIRPQSEVSRNFFVSATGYAACSRVQKHVKE